jgi:catechol 2,3-dioxygenase-like lactoylglutathione lyase family enzyme
MTETIRGLHHVTAIAIDPQANIDFYTRLLGLRFAGDAVFQVGFEHPDWYNGFEHDPEEAARVRVRESLVATHLSFPSVCHVQRFRAPERAARETVLNRIYGPLTRHRHNPAPSRDRV